RGPPKMEQGIEVRVVDPYRPGHRQGREQHFLAKPRNEMQARRDHLDQVVVGEPAARRRRRVQDGQAADVLMDVRLLYVQEGSVLRPQPLHDSVEATPSRIWR